jgi:hypothetical protein
MSSNEITTLEAIEQKVVYFLEDELVAARATDGHIYVSLRHLCQALGLDRYGQVQRIQRQLVLSQGHYYIEIETAGGQQTANMLRVDLVPLWLSGISTRSLKQADIRAKLERYQAEAAKVLWEAFQDGRLTTSTTLDDLLTSDSPAAQAYKMAAAIMRMAQQQLLLEAQLENHTSQLLDHESRLESIESQLGDPGQHVTPEQAMQISQAVKAVAQELGKRTKRNEYGGVYGELYRRYGINSYKALPKNSFDDARNWLNEWLQSLISDSPF